MEECPPIWRVAANILNKQLRTADKGCSSRLRLGEMLTTSSVKTYFVTKYLQEHQTWTDILV